MKKILPILFCYLNFSFAIAQEKLWDKSLYKKYDYKSFEKSELAKQTIEAKKIDYPLLNAAVFYRSNKEREKRGLPQFTHSQALEKAAFEHSKDMVNKKFFSHQSPVAGKENHIKRLALVGVTNLANAENIFKKYTQKTTYLELANALVEGWMKSEKHQENMLNRKYRFLGCGVYYFYEKEYEDYLGFMATQNFSAIDSAWEEFKE